MMCDFCRIPRDVVLEDFDEIGKALLTFSFLAKFQILLKIHDFDSELNDKHGNQLIQQENQSLNRNQRSILIETSDFGRIPREVVFGRF
ncbi:hypothetical protein OUZ56_023357 [Daphnia magna]|uniref:Uncharacterized protein n=1 Tax=Daphnia magna TaxID=35525 RepID=A0ABR0AZ03_9CRUS|nr:hypothetical protein OUZ56_023357 [Daphnia magna]